MAHMTMGLAARDSVSPAQVLAQTGMALGSRILTAKGYAAVEDIEAGDRVISRDTGMVRVAEVRRTQLSLPMIRIKTGAFNDGCPERDLLVGCDQPIFVRDWRAQAMFKRKSIMVSAAKLFDGEFIVSDEDITATVVQILFDRPHILYVGGLELGCAASLPDPL